MRKFIYLAVFCVWSVPSIFAQDGNLIQRCIDKSQSLKSYHTDIYYRDLFDKKTEDKNYNSIEWKVDRINPDKVYVEQMALTDGSADIWISIKDRIFRFFGAWIETTGEPKDTFDYRSFLLLDKYLDVLRNESPFSQSQDVNLVLISYAPKELISFAKSLQLQDGYSCNIKIWINPQDDLIQKAYINLDGKYKKGEECRFEMTQIFTNYNSAIKIEEPETANIKVKSEFIWVKIISTPRAKGDEIVPRNSKGFHHMAIVSDILPHGIWEVGPDSNGKIITTNTIPDLSSWQTHLTTQKCLELDGEYVQTQFVKVNKKGLIDSINLYEKSWVGEKYIRSNYNENYAVETVICGAGGDIKKAKKEPEN